MVALTHAHDDWPALLQAARGWPALASLRDAPDHELALLLKVPVAAAWWIATFAPELLERRKLDLLIVGMPGGPAAADEGRPYQLLPRLAGHPDLAVNASVILWHPDPQVPQPRGATAHISLHEHGAEGRPAAFFEGSLVDWLSARGRRTPDLCLLMHPAFDQRIEFWTGLRCLLGAGTRVGAFARGPEKVDRDAWLLGAYGYEVHPAPKPNPWARHRPELRGHGAYANVGWELDPEAAVSIDAPVDVARLEHAREAQAFLQHEFEVWNPFQFIGQVQHAEDDTSADPESFVGMPDHHALSLRTGEMWALESERRVPAAGIRLPPEVVATYPGTHVTAFERLLWAVEVYRNEFRPREAAASELAGEVQARHLRERVTQSLHGHARAQEIGAITEYLSGGAAPTAPTPGSEALFAALAAKNWGRAAAQVAADPSLVAATDAEGRSPLFYVVDARQTELVRRWLEAGAEPDHLDHEGFAVIHDVVKRDDTMLLELLHRYGADLDLGTGIGLTPAVLALRYGCWNALAYLLAQRVDLRKSLLDGAAVADQYEQVASLPRVLRSTIEQQLGKRRVIPIGVRASQPGMHAGR